MNSFYMLNKEIVSCVDNGDISVCYNNITTILLESLKEITTILLESLMWINIILSESLRWINNMIIDKSIESLMNIDKSIESFMNIDMNVFKNEYYYYLYNVSLVLVLIYLFYKLSRFNDTLTTFNNNDIVIVNKNSVYKIIKRLKEEICILKEENNILINDKEKYTQDNKKKQIKNIPSNQIYDELERIRHILSSDDRAAKKICLLNNMLNTDDNDKIY